MALKERKVFYLKRDVDNKEQELGEWERGEEHAGVDVVPAGPQCWVINVITRKELRPRNHLL